jgi:hypothetical protein
MISHCVIFFIEDVDKKEHSLKKHSVHAAGKTGRKEGRKKGRLKRKGSKEGKKKKGNKERRQEGKFK